MTGQEAADLIHQRAWVGQKPGLDRIRRLLGRLGNPQEKLKFVHIAGSNGKGSTAAMLASVLSAAGLKTGCTPPPTCGSSTSGSRWTARPSLKRIWWTLPPGCWRRRRTRPSSS